MPGHVTDAFRSLRQRREAPAPSGASAQGVTLDLSGWVVPGNTGLTFDFSDFALDLSHLTPYPPVDALTITAEADAFTVPDGLYLVNLTMEPDVAPSAGLLISLQGNDLVGTSLTGLSAVDPALGPVSKLCWMVAAEPISIYALNMGPEDLTYLILKLDLFKIG